MTWKCRAQYIPPFPESPSDGQVFVDINTGISWTYSTGTGEWTQTP
jgi:hypothetical protein